MWNHAKLFTYVYFSTIRKYSINNLECIPKLKGIIVILVRTTRCQCCVLSWDFRCFTGWQSPTRTWIRYFNAKGSLLAKHPHPHPLLPSWSWLPHSGLSFSNQPILHTFPSGASPCRHRGQPESQSGHGGYQQVILWWTALGSSSSPATSQMCALYLG